MNHTEIKEQLPLYVLGGLDDETAAAVARHLAESCDSCAAEMREWQEIVGLLPLGVTQDGPSEMVKDRLMARVRQDAGKKVVPLRPRGRRIAWIALPLAAAASVALVIGNRFYQDVVKRASEQARRAETATDLLRQEQEKLAAREAEVQRLTVRLGEQQAVVKEKTQHITQLESTLARQQAELAEQRRLVSLREQELAQVQGAGASRQTQIAAYEQEVTALRADLTRQRELATARERELHEMRLALDQQKAVVEANIREAEQLREAMTRQRGIIEVLTAPGLRVSYLQKAKLGVSTQGHVLWNERKKAWLFYAFGMPQPPPGKEYQVWFMTEREGPVSAGLFTPDQTGTGVVLAQPPSRLYGDILAAAVTLEPAGGLPKPSGEMYLRGSL
jgi:hypothetical protein